MPRVVVALLLLVASVSTGVLVPASVASAPASAEEGRTWVVDAVDDTSSNRWDSVDTGTTVVTIRVGDTVEWQFDRATQGHDLISLPPSGAWETAWPEPLEEYRDAGGAPVTYTFDEPGTYRYECSLHGPMMSGTIIVTDVEGNTPPTADPVVEPVSGPAPLVVHATANASDADGDVVATSWDFGTGAAATYTDHAMFEYVTPGQYVVRLRASDGRGGLYVPGVRDHRHRRRWAHRPRAARRRRRASRDRRVWPRPGRGPLPSASPSRRRSPPPAPCTPTPPGSRTTPT